jgi:hypothetical protein
LLKVENIKVSNMQNALRGMRNAMASWDKADSTYDNDGNIISLGNNDKELAIRLVKSGSDHRKFLRQIFFSCDIIAPDYWFKEFSTYKVATVENSTSTMHRLTYKKLTEDCFSWDKTTPYRKLLLDMLNTRIIFYKKLLADNRHEEAKELWRELIQDLPMSFNYRRTWTASYETLRNVYPARENHKVSEWHIFCDMIDALPLSKELITVSPWYIDKIEELKNRIKELEGVSNEL